MRTLELVRLVGGLLCGSLLLAGGPGPAPARAAESSPLPYCTNLLQVQRLVSQAGMTNCALRLEGVICAVNPARSLAVLQDESGVGLLEVEFAGAELRAGQRVCWEESGCCVRRTELGVALVRQLVVENDGIHPLTNASGSVWLQAGFHPLRLTWFNGPSKAGLTAYYQGPGLARQAIPDAVLFRPEPKRDGQGTNLVNGLEYRCFEGAWESLPNFKQLTPVRSGFVPNFDLKARSRDASVGLEFSGYLQVPAAGLYTFELSSDDGSRLYINEGVSRLEVLGTAPVPPPQRLALGQPWAPQSEGQWVELEGRADFVREAADRWSFELRVGTSRVQVEVLRDAGPVAVARMPSQVRARGLCTSLYTVSGQRVPGRLLVLSSSGLEVLEPAPARSRETEPTVPSRLTPVAAPGAAPLPLLTAAEQVKQLTREEADRGYPVQLRGIVTRVGPGRSAVLQDATWGVYVVRVPVRAGEETPRLADYWEVRGVTAAGDFAPIVTVRQAHRVGPGLLPEPIQPTWDQLRNGSLDTQYVELQGLVTGVQTNRLELLLREGKILLTLPDYTAGTLQAYLNTLIRVRGCLLPAWNRQTHQLRVGEVFIFNSTIAAEEPPPADLFAMPAKRAAELLLYDFRANAFQRVKIAGQFLGAHAGLGFLLDGTNGLRFLAKTSPALQAGDQVEVVGFPELEGPSPVLREATVRRSGHSALPPPTRLLADNLFHKGLDATRVRLEGLLVDQRRERGAQVLELQVGLRTVVARLEATNALLRLPPLGSRLELTGIYLGQGGGAAAGRDFDSFELWLEGADGVRLLARPSWWTLPRLLNVLGTLVCLMVLAAVWITQLRRQVEQRTMQLQVEIRERQRAEHLQALEAERARIARDLHDDLGTSLTEIGLLAADAATSPPVPAQVAPTLSTIAGKAQNLVTSLDAIVWAADPQKDHMASLAGYLASFVEEYTAAAGLNCRVEIQPALPALLLASEMRHGLYLAVKEAVHNAVKHGQATEICFGFALREHGLEIAVADNGRGFEAAAVVSGDGLRNFQQRLTRLGGCCEVQSRPGLGTTVRIRCPLGASA